MLLDDATSQGIAELYKMRNAPGGGPLLSTLELVYQGIGRDFDPGARGFSWVLWILLAVFTLFMVMVAMNMLFSLSRQASIAPASSMPSPSGENEHGCSATWN